VKWHDRHLSAGIDGEDLEVLVASEHRETRAPGSNRHWARPRVIAHAIDVAKVAAMTVKERPDVALVGLGPDSEHALGMIDEIVREPPAR
jgi:hypothetical protein